MTKKKRPSSSTDAAEFLDDLLGQPASLGQTLRALRLSEERAAAWAAALGQSPALCVELAVQSQLRSACLPFVVKIHAAPRSVGRRPLRRGA